MTAVVTSLVALFVLLIAVLVFVGVRDRRRFSSSEDSRAAHAARSEQEQHAAERHGVQGETWHQDRASGM
ncbi:hypothetical protein ACWDV4_17145 [Micromonospora sp. NPDC003197]